MSWVPVKTAIGSTRASKDTGNTKDSDLPMEVIADSFIGLLVDLFTMLPAGGCQELFSTLYSVYPTPVDVKQFLKKGHCKFKEWQQQLLDGTSTLSQLCSCTLFPKQLPSIEDFERQLAKAIEDYGYGTRVYHRARAKLRMQHYDERAEILKLCRIRFSVSANHVSFLEQLCKGLREANSPFQFQVQLLLGQVSYCTASDWTRDANRFGDQFHCDHLLTSTDYGSSLQALRDMWKFSISPETVLQLMEAVKDRAAPQRVDIICDILISVLDYQVSLHPHVMTLLLAISAKPDAILQAVNAISCSLSDNCENPNHCKTTVIQCVEVLGKSYNIHKASGAKQSWLLKLRIKAADLLHHARYNHGTWLSYQYGLGLGPCKDDSVIDIQSVMEIVYDSGQQALDDLLDLVVKNPGRYLLPTLKGMNELSHYCHRNNPSDQSRPLQLPPFKETVTSLLEKRKKDIKEIATSNGENSKLRHLLNDLKASFQFLGLEEDFTTFSSVSRNTHRQVNAHGYKQQLMMPLDEVYGDDDGEENLGHQAAAMRMMSTARVRVRRKGFLEWH